MSRDINTKLVMSMLIKLLVLVIQFIICKSTSELLVITSESVSYLKIDFDIKFCSGECQICKIN